MKWAEEMKRIHFDNITDYNKMRGRPAPEHPLFTVVSVKASNRTSDENCLDSQAVISTEFYAIGFKKVITGDLFYGKTKYDYQNGTMLFFAPNQEFSARGVTIEADAKMIIFHEDFVRGHPIHETIKKYSFFGYAANEALHLSPKEEQLVSTILDAIETEYKSSYDEFSRDILFSQIETLLKYSDRFYRRQFLLRNEHQSSTYEKFEQSFDALFCSADNKVIPSISDIADNLNMTSRYLTDALRVETGKSAKEWIQLRLIEHAKNSLLESDESVAVIAYGLGFEYPQYFSRLFKKKVGMTPTEYRSKYH